MSPQERWDYWMGEFERCIRCYACRSVCPTCYCPQCLADKNQPQGIDSSPLARGNLAWQLVRAFHHAGRCVECGECERACPMDIPLVGFMSGMRDVVREKFACEPGQTADATCPLGTYSEDDKEDFFR
jgi:ferredoxin